jgi:sulfatase maturation enzyme AslB (radical SAM superfamily)
MWDDHVPRSFEDHWNSDQMKEIRVNMLNFEPKHAICKRCIEGNNTETPYYYWQNDKANPHIEEILAKTKPDGYTTYVPRTLDIRTDLCNFKCRMCYVDASTSIRKEVSAWKSKYPTFEISERGYVETFDEIGLTDEHLKLVEQITWAGGEPFMSPIHWTVMEKLIRLDNYPSLYYNTNMSFPGKTLDKTIDILKHFPDVMLAASIDGTWEDVEYIREGLSYSKFLSNLAKLKAALPRAKFHVGYTATSIGLLTLSDVIQLCIDEDMKFEGRLAMVNDRNHLGIGVLKRHVFETLMEDVLVVCKGSKWEEDVVAYVGFLRTNYREYPVDYKYLDIQEEMRGKAGFYRKRMEGLVNE